MRNQRQKLMIAMTLCIASPLSFASLWIETSDPFMRTHLQGLSDDRYLTHPTASYPQPWSLASDKLNTIYSPQLTANHQLNYRYLKHYRDQALIRRGTQAGRLIWNSQSRLSTGYGDTAHRFEWKTELQTESIQRDYAYRLTIGYGKEWDKKSKLNLENSYLAFGDANKQWSISQLDRWWGHGWSNSLTWSQAGAPLENINVGMILDPWLGAELWVETNISKLDQSIGAKYLSSSRLAANMGLMELAVSTQYAFNNHSQFDHSTALAGTFYHRDVRNSLDIKIPLSGLLPRLSSTSVYGSYMHQNSYRDSDQEAVLYGLTTQQWLFEQSWHFYLEQLKWKRNANTAIQQRVTAPEPDNLSMGLRLSLANDDKLALIYRYYDQHGLQPSLKTYHLTYQRLLFGGMLDLSLHHQQTDDNDQFGVGTRWTLLF